MDLKALLAQLEKTQWEKRAWPLLRGPVITRQALQNMRAPKGDFVTKTSGATGIPVEIQRTNLSLLWASATNLREALWYKRNLAESFAVIRPIVEKETSHHQWGPAFALLGKTGPLYAHPVQGDLNRWLQKIQPGYLMTYPSILETIDLAALTRLIGIKTTGETLHQKHPLIADMYSSEEVGTIAIQCPDNPESYHVMENILVEILDEQDKPADIGRVIVTDLTSQYLYRYEIGDYAIKGTCDCGRGLQTLKKILGRRRNRVLLPDGSTHWPRVGSLFYRTIAPIKRFQVAQIGATTLEFRFMIDTPLSQKQTQSFVQLIQKWIGYPFAIEFVPVESFPCGKFEEFINPYMESLQRAKISMSQQGSVQPAHK